MSVSHYAPLLIQEPSLTRLTLQQCGDDNRILCIIRHWRGAGAHRRLRDLLLRQHATLRDLEPAFAQAGLAHYNWRSSVTYI